MLGFCLGLIKYVVLARICFIDFREKIIKDRDLVILLVIGILLGVERNNFEKVYLGWCAFSMPLLILYIVEDYFKKELIGFGDVKLMIVIGGLLR